MIVAMRRAIAGRMLSLLAAVLPVAPAVSTGAEPVDLLVRNWNSGDGLPQDHIRAIAQTPDGFLWLGTDAGLARFDGSVFKTYGLRDGLPAVTVLSLLGTGDGALWIGTLGAVSYTHLTLPMIYSV